MELTKISVKEFKRIENVELELANVNILVGSNSSGKSSVLQALHLAACMIRQVDSISTNTPKTVGVGVLDYLPTENYKSLGHLSNWGNMQGTPSSTVRFEFEDNDTGTSHEVWGQMRSARNAGISITGTVPLLLNSRFRRADRFFTAYIPGISGIPNREEKRGYKAVLRACSYGDSNVILRNALHILETKEPGSLRKIESWLTQLIGPVALRVNYADKDDLHIECTFSRGGLERPLELAGTGYLQLIQIFCYILLFKPGLLLIDEPDIHLNPTVQQKLVPLLERIALANNLKILLTTHSPFLLRGAPPTTLVYWIDQGLIQNSDRKRIELALGWGAFGKKILLLTEDGNRDFMDKILSQWPSLQDKVAILPGEGFKRLPTPDQAAQLAGALEHTFKVVVHRDRDSLTDAEITELKAQYAAVGVFLWVPISGSVESYFCNPEIVAIVSGRSVEDSAALIESCIASRSAELNAKFLGNRENAVKEFYRTGGGPTPEAVRTELSTLPLKGFSGKPILAELKNKLNGNFGLHLFGEAVMNIGIAPDLKNYLENIL